MIMTNDGQDPVTTLGLNDVVDSGDVERALPSLPSSPLSEGKPKKLTRMEIFRAMGPGIMAGMADTDGPGLITTAQSGATFAYSLLLTQILLIPVLFMAQELTVRLGLYTGQGMTELVKRRFGLVGVIPVAAVVLVVCVGALVSEVVAIAQVGELFAVRSWISATVTVVFLLIVIVSGSYRTVEKVAVGLGLFQFIFLPLIFITQPKWGDVWMGLWDYSWIVNSTEETTNSASFLGLISANIGAVVMTWMLFYQQSAICDKSDLHTSRAHLKIARIDTGVGCVLTQTVMSAMVISIASATAQKQITGKDLTIEKVNDIVYRLQDFLGGELSAKILLALGIVGSSLVAAIVASLCGAWVLTEALGAPRSLDMSCRTAPIFYSGYFVVLAGSVVATVLLGENMAVKFSIGVQIMNAYTMPLVLGLIFLFSTSDLLPEHIRLSGWYKWVVLCVFTLISAFGVAAAITGHVN
eukprot:GEMP01007823.1.p1 GENE.GEMP01007823.1~~GEMP01007823.1.p1  ORF type:complete len:468 (-),score=77.47 GEMP01007823.1:2144-3547(-)